MIRQAISCDICGAEKKQTNHWFVACELAGELRVSGWNSRNRLRAGAKHLCGQACLHKLADDFMARVIALKAASKAPAVEELEAEESVSRLAATQAAAARGTSAPRSSPAIMSAKSDTSLTSPLASAEFESSARIFPSAPMIAPRPAAGLVTMPERSSPQASLVVPEAPPRFPSRDRRAEAWQRERERTQEAGESRKGRVVRRAGS